MVGYPKTAACACGALTATAKASPSMVHACSCLACQRRSGSVFTYSAFFADADVTIAGDYKTWRRDSEAGRFHETSFCPTCGCAMFYRLEALPGVICIPVGSFGDPAFMPPGRLYWTAHRHEWLTTFADLALIERQ
jgi:hypothetical protein